LDASLAKTPGSGRPVASVDSASHANCPSSVGPEADGVAAFVATGVRQNCATNAIATLIIRLLNPPVQTVSTALPTVDRAARLMVQAVGRATVRRMPGHSFIRGRFFRRPTLRSFKATVRAIVIVTLVGFMLGCDRNIEPYKPGEQSSQPDLARIFPGPTAGTETVDANSEVPDRSALPPSRAEGSAVASRTDGPAIEGRIELAAELARPAAGVLFVIARPQGSQGGPPLAVLRIADPEFPLEFRIGPENVMIPSMRFEGAISLSARLDADGNAMTRGSGDISSQVQEPLAPGASGVTLILDERG